MSVNNGGPAFPVTPTDRSGQVAETQLGMSMRDYFAAHVDIGNVDDLSHSTGETLLGRKCPSYQFDLLGCLLWWAEYRARLRYIEADAMVRASESYLEVSE